MANHLLLTGAGFSRNWGGWLALEAFEYLLASRDLDEGIRNALWKHRRVGGFEAALSEVQEEYRQKESAPALARLKKVQGAISQMFLDMNKGFETTPFESSNDRQRSIARFLTRFDAIFTLNQDVLLEGRYLNGNVETLSEGKWGGWQIPGMRKLPQEGLANDFTAKWKVLPEAEFKLDRRLQPYVKIHGSGNWVDDQGGDLLVIGGNKGGAIKQHKILAFNLELLKSYLNQPNTRLMVVGYGFGDDHINAEIRNAAKTANLQLFVVDPLGIDVLDKNRGAVIYSPDEFFQELEPRLVGASRRSLASTFGSDQVEFNKLQKFFVAG